MRTNWWRIPQENVNCTADQMEEVIQGYFGLYQVASLDSDGKDTLSGMVKS